MTRTLLLADDSVTIQKVVKISFANDDLEVVAVDNGDDAVETARSLRPDVILADVVMPGRSGYEVCAAIRDDPALCDVPVLLLAGTTEDFDGEHAERVGASGHLTKPFEAQTLVERVHALLDAAASSRGGHAEAPSSLDHPSEVFRFGGDDLDLPLLPEEPETALLAAAEASDALREEDADSVLLESELLEDDDQGPDLFAELLDDAVLDEEMHGLDDADVLGEPQAQAEVERLPAPVPNPSTARAEFAMPADQLERLVERVIPTLREELHQSLERIAWEAFGDLSKQIVAQAVERVETIAWETVPKLAETLILEEIRKLEQRN
ncbi:MAG: response regulator [Myxococcales bacterium]|nr:response regulator [Myxococcales bacterium]